MKYDTIIIGAGLSGLAAGIRLAYYDQNVLILEKHTTIGGLNSFYRLRGRNYDVGLHAITNYAAPGTKTGPLAKLLKQLRLRWDDFNLTPQKGSAVVFPEHRLNFSNDFQLLQQEINQQFPDQIDGFNRLTLKIEQFDDTNLNQPYLSARQIVQEHISDSTLEDMLFCPLMFYGSPTPHDMDFCQFVIMFKSIFLQGFSRPAEGIRLILKNLVRKFKSLGGELKLRGGVEQILVQNGKACGVRLEDGTEYECDVLLSSAGSLETFRMTQPQGDELPETAPQPGALSFIESIYALDQYPAELGIDETIIFYNNAPRFSYAPCEEPADLSSGIICSPNNFEYEDPSLVKEGPTLRATVIANPHYWMNLSEEAYRSAKDVWFPQILDKVTEKVAPFREHIVDTDMFTPKTIWRFTGHANGAVYGAPVKLRDGQTHLDNLYLCGTDQGFLGIIGSMLSGISIANLYVLSRM
ncbi:MAG: NAD(P)/FAD-dependent oxidoreductase [Planctomycetaceae bacterium]